MIQGNILPSHDTFVELTRLLTKRGESKAGLSTYYINLRYSASVFTQMMKRVSCFAYVDSDEQRAVKTEADSLIEEWKNIQMFLMWEYSNRHLKIEDCDRAHCCTYALGTLIWKNVKQPEHLSHDTS